MCSVTRRCSHGTKQPLAGDVRSVAEGHVWPSQTTCVVVRKNAAGSPDKSGAGVSCRTRRRNRCDRATTNSWSPSGSSVWCTQTKPEPNNRTKTRGFGGPCARGSPLHHPADQDGSRDQVADERRVQWCGRQRPGKNIRRGALASVVLVPSVT